MFNAPANEDTTEQGYTDVRVKRCTRHGERPEQRRSGGHDKYRETLFIQPS